MTDQELKSLQFYLSASALIKENGVPMRMERETPGIVTEVGPDWIRVSFEKGRPGAYFVADPNDRLGGYYCLGAKFQDAGIRPLKDATEKTFTSDGATCEVITGTTALLLVSAGDIEKIIESRKLIEGRVKGR